MALNIPPIRRAALNALASYEYRVVALAGTDPHGGDLSGMLTALGRQSWRLVAVADRYVFLERETAPEAAHEPEPQSERPQLRR